MASFHDNRAKPIRPDHQTMLYFAAAGDSGSGGGGDDRNS